ncbi:MAG: MFS transporter, partial [Dehalococcoidia bacterium]|nr:MFS transporter [Dehalococcoidia bacterium]
QAKPKSAAVSALRALKHPNFKWFLFGAVGQTTAQGMQQLTLGWLVLELTNSASQLGIVIFLQGVPMMIFMMYGGVLADRLSRIKLLVVSQLLTMPILIILGVLAATGNAKVWQVYVASLVIGAIQAVMFPARHAIVRDMVPREDVLNAVVLNSTLQNLTQIIGPSIAGFIIGGLGIAFALYVNAAFYIIGILALLMISGVTSLPQTGKTSVAKEMMDGVKYTWKVPPVFATIAIGCVMGFFIHPVSQLMPAFAKQELNLGAEGAGTLLMFAGIGSLVGNATMAVLGDIKSKWRVMLWASVVYGIAIFAFSFVHWYWLALFLMLFVGGGRMVFVTLGSTLIQLMTSQRYTGRAMSLWSVGVALMFVGALPMGFLGDLISLRFAIAAAAVAYLLLTFCLGFLWPPLRKLGNGELVVEPPDVPIIKSSPSAV